MSLTRNRRLSPVILLMAVLALLAALVASSSTQPASARTLPNWMEYAYTDFGLSQSNILFSFTNESGSVVQAYIDRGNCGGQKTAPVPPTNSSCYLQGQGYVPYNMWINAHWCAGYQYATWSKADGHLISSGPWTYRSGGANGVSAYVEAIPVNRDTDVMEVRAYLVPNGYAGCVA